MIVLVGESASGKSSIERILADKYHYTKTVSYTTRPPRNEDGKKEIDGVDYNFISMDEFVEKFNTNFFIETGAYLGWFYGTTENQYSNNTVCVLTPHGLRQIRKNLKNKDLDIVAFYIKVPRRDRLIKALQRGDDVDDATDRNKRDVGQYDGIEDEVDFVLDNAGYTSDIESMADWVIECVNKKMKEKN